MPSPSLTGTVLNSKWRLGALVGAGACADVYEAMDASAGATAESGKFVAKICPLPVDLPPRPQWKRKEEKKKADTLYHEHMLYRGFLLPRLRNLGCVVEIPIDGYGEDNNLRYLVMTRLGPDILTAKEAANEKSEPWSESRTAGYALQMLKILRALHERCEMVFVDVKPDNFLFGQPGSEDEDKIFLVDFGLTETFTEYQGPIKLQTKGGVQGTPEYLSLKCHDGWKAGRCDDLESLGYVIVSMFKKGSSKLPWSDSTSIEDGLDIKTRTSVKKLCQGCPAGVLEYVKAVRDMAYGEEPNYEILNAKLQSTARAKRGRSPVATAAGDSECPAKLRRSPRFSS
ncbi:unnamed protein product [Ectocarpus fasciculatus]